MEINHSNTAYQLNSVAMSCWWDLAIYIRRHTGLQHVSYIYVAYTSCTCCSNIFTYYVFYMHMFQAFAFQIWGTFHVGGKEKWVKFVRLGCTAGRTRLWRCNPPPGSLETRDSWQLECFEFESPDFEDTNSERTWYCYFIVFVHWVNRSTLVWC